MQIKNLDQKSIGTISNYKFVDNNQYFTDWHLLDILYSYVRILTLAYKLNSRYIRNMGIGFINIGPPSSYEIEGFNSKIIND